MFWLTLRLTRWATSFVKTTEAIPSRVKPVVMRLNDFDSIQNE
jgi:hypothetical protein